MRKKIILRADAGKDIGYGHFVRTLALAGYLSEDFECFFYTFNPDLHRVSDYQLSEIKKVCQYQHIAAASIDEYDKSFVDSLSGGEIVVLDNYYFSTRYQQEIKDKGCRLVCIDDMHDRHMVADVVMTFCPLKRKDFSLESYTDFYGGIEWSFLRSPFLKTATSHRSCSKIQSIVMAMGGADPYGLTDKLISIIRSIDDKIALSVIAGDTVEISPEFIDKINLYRRLTAEEIVKLFAKTDIGIFPASTICIEAFSQKLPVAAGWYVDNQEEFYKEGTEQKWFFPLGNFLDSPNILSKRIEQFLDDPMTLSTVDVDFIAQREKIRNIFLCL